jgi:hypothetical protein
MDKKKEKDFATYKEFGKMLREVASLCAKYGDTPLYESVPELKKKKVFFVVNRGAYDAYIDPWMMRETPFADHPVDVTEAKKRWGDYVADCHAKKGIECNYQEYLKKQ